MSLLILKDESHSIKKSYSKFVQEAMQADICLSVGGDTYCYGENPIICCLSEELVRRGKKVYLWAASIGQEDLSAAKLKNLSKISGLFLRESLTYELLKSKGINKNIFLHADPAFLLEAKKAKNPNFQPRPNTLGINVSPLAEAANAELLDILAALLEDVLENSSLSLSFIAHVEDDWESLEKLRSLISKKYADRLYRIDKDFNAAESKYYISKLRFFICTRTHASIAAYSSGVPTMVLGYSAKARGIAKDIFGKPLYLVDLKGTSDIKKDLYQTWESLRGAEEAIREALLNKMPAIRRSALEAGQELLKAANMKEGRA